jgi:hypothetical protein
VSTDFYTTLAQVLPLLLLALIWDSAYLERLRGQQRRSRRIDPDGVRFWTKPRVRAYILMITGSAVASTAIAVLVLARLIPDSYTLRVVLSCGLVLVLGSVLYRIYYDVLAATSTSGEREASKASAADDNEPPPPPADSAPELPRQG